MVLKRRSFIKTALAAGSVAMLPTSVFATSNKQKRRVVVVGGGFAGATAAKYMQLWDADLEVILIERNAQFVSCPQSNLVLGGSRNLQQLLMITKL